MGSWRTSIRKKSTAPERKRFDRLSGFPARTDSPRKTLNEALRSSTTSRGRPAEAQVVDQPSEPPQRLLLRFAAEEAEDLCLVPLVHRRAGAAGKRQKRRAVGDDASARVRGDCPLSFIVHRSNFIVVTSDPIDRLLAILKLSSAEFPLK